MSSFEQSELCLNCANGDGKPVTCWVCEGPLNGGFCSFCALRAGNSFAYDPNPNSFNDSPSVFTHPSQLQFETYLCKLCGNNAHYGYDCPPQFLLVYEQEPCYNQNFNDNYFPQNSQSSSQQYICCQNCGDPHATFECQPMSQNLYNSNSFGFDQFQPPQFPVIHQPPQETSAEILQARKNLMNYIQTFLKKFNRISFRETTKVLTRAWEKFFEIQHAQPEEVQELLSKLLQDLKSINEDLAEYINLPSWNCPYGDEHLSTIPKTESNKVIKSSVENLVPIPSESEDFFDIESECDVPVCDDFTTSSIPLFDFDDDFSSSDNKSFCDEDVPNEIYSNPLFDEEIIFTKIDPHHFNAESNIIESLLNRDTLIDSSPKFDYLLEEFSGELAHINPIPPGIEEADFDLEEKIRLVENLSYEN
ncbi:hypothetical protein Tco_0016443 [Tanacetum coccineum]